MSNIIETLMILASFIVVLFVATYAAGTVVDNFVDKTLPFGEDIESDLFRSMVPGVYGWMTSIYLVVPVLMVFGFVWAFKRIFFKTRYRREEFRDEDEFYR